MSANWVASGGASLAPAGREVAGDLPGPPGTALRRAADHHRVGAGGRERGGGILVAADVAVDDDRDRDAVLDGANRRPVGAALVELAARSSVHRDRRTPASCARRASSGALIERSSQPSRILSVTGTRTAPTVASIKRQRMVEIAHQRRARLAAGHVPRRAAHVDVDDGGAGRLGDARALPHPARLAAGELHHVNAQSPPLGAQPRVRAALGQVLAGGHLRDHQAGAEAGDAAPKRGVGHARHRRQDDRARQRQVADQQRAGTKYRRRQRHLESLHTN